jgi:hypothetical protein
VCLTHLESETLRPQPIKCTQTHEYKKSRTDRLPYLESETLSPQLVADVRNTAVSIAVVNGVTDLGNECVLVKRQQRRLVALVLQLRRANRPVYEEGK